MALVLEKVPDQEVKLSITYLFWSLPHLRSSSLRDELVGYEPYFEFYYRCTNYAWFSIKTHQNLITLIETLAENPDNDLGTAIKQTKHLFPNNGEDEIATRQSMNLALKVWLFLDTTWTWSSGPDQWQPEESLGAYLCRKFPVTQTALDTSESLLDSNFSASNLRRLYGVQVKWTNYLTHHLHFQPEEKLLHVFRPIIFLSIQSK